MKASSIIAAVAVIAAVIISAVVVLDCIPESKSADEIDVYTDIGISATIENRDGDTVLLTATVSDGTEFGGWYDASGKLLSESTEYNAKVYTDTVYAYAKSYTTVEAGSSVDIIDMLSADGSGSLTITASDYDGSEAIINGSTVTFESFGLYTVTYSGNDSKHCARILADGTVTNTFGWQYSAERLPSDLETAPGIHENDFTITLEIKYSDYRHYQEIYENDRYSHYLNNGKTDENASHDTSYVDYDDVQDKYISQIAKYISEVSEGTSAQTTANIILAFTQYVEYKTDSDVHGEDEYFQFPLETLFLGSGDCEDTSILYCAIANYMGYDTTLVLFQGHMGTGTNLDEYKSLRNSSVSSARPGVYGWKMTVDGTEKSYYFGETTATGWLIGEVPASVYSNYLGMLQVPEKSVETVIPSIIASDGVEVSTEEVGYGFVRLTATLGDGSEFLGWFDENGNLISTETSIDRRFSEGEMIYAVADSYLNKDTSIKSGETIPLSSLPGSESWTILTSGASKNADNIVFDGSGAYLVSYPSETGTAYGVVYVYADVTVYASPGLSVEVSGGDLCTVITVTADSRTSYSGIYTANGELFSESTIWSGSIADGTILFVFSKDYDAIGAIGTEIDLPEETGVSGNGTWAYTTGETFDGILKLETGGYYIITYTDGESKLCFRVFSTMSGQYMTFDIEGWEKSGFFNVTVRGTMTTSYLSYDSERGAYQIRQTYSFEDGRNGDNTYWSDESSTEDLTSEFVGTYTLTTANYGDRTCIVYMVTYTSQSGYTTTETQYYDASDGITLYKITVNQYQGPFLVSYSTYDLSDCSYLEKN